MGLPQTGRTLTGAAAFGAALGTEVPAFALACAGWTAFGVIALGAAFGAALGAVSWVLAVARAARSARSAAASRLTVDVAATGVTSVGPLSMLAATRPTDAMPASAAMATT